MNKVFFWVIALFCFSPWASGGLALFLGLLLGLFLKNPYQLQTKKYTSQLLQFSVIGLGAGMNLKIIAAVGLEGIGYTIAGIAFAFISGAVLFRFFKTDKKVSTLITVGTAICGGSAIAAVSPVIDASEDEISVSLACIFLLNAAALFLFPQVGHFFRLDQQQFGLWSALAIHDTSSVVGASMSYGKEALQIATTIKLARALWIIPVTLVIALLHAGKNSGAKKIKYPWFIGGFLLMAALFTWWTDGQVLGSSISTLAKKCLVLTLFLIGSGLSVNSIKKVGFKPLLYALALWILVSLVSLYAVKSSLIA